MVAGARIRNDGTACPALLRRVARGVELYNEGVAPCVVMTGRGAGPRAEAPVMAEIARQLGMPDSALSLEAESMSTAENARFCRELLSVQRIVVVSCPAHVHRCEQLFGAYFEAVHGAPSAWGPRRAEVRMFVRETAIAAWQG